MRRRPLGHLSLIAIGAPLALGALVAVGVRHVLFGSSGAPGVVDWIYLFASPSLALIAVVLLHIAWWRRRWPFADPAGPIRPSEWEWLLLTAACAVGLGFYAGALHHLSLGLNMSAVLAYFVLLPLAILSVTFGYAPGRGLLRLVAMMAELEASTQVSHSLSQRGGLRYWDEITWANAIFLVGGVVVTLCILWPFQERVRARAEQLRATPRTEPAPELPPRRATRAG